MALPAVAAPQAAAAAVWTAHCTELTQWDFAPGNLNLSFKNESINASYSGVCGGASYTGDWINQNVGPGSWTNSYPYSGSCLLAGFGYGYNWSTGQYEGSGILVGGSAAWAISGNSNYGPNADVTEVTLLVSNNGNPCDIDLTLQFPSQGAFAAYS